MANFAISGKHLQVDKAQATRLAIIAIAATISVFCLIASRSLFYQMNYQNKVINEKKKADKQLKSNIQAVNKMAAEYKIFNEEDPNLLGGSKTGSGELDGENARIVLDSLPSKYDFPAVASSLEKIVLKNNAKFDGITGNDDEALQITTGAGASTPQPLSFSLDATTSYKGSIDLVSTLEKSIRPFNIKKITLTGNNANLKVTIDAETYYQPSKSVTITEKIVK